MTNPFDKYLPKDLLSDSSSLPGIDADTAQKRLSEIAKKRREIERMRLDLDQKIKAENEKGVELDSKLQEIQAEIDRLLGGK